MTKSPRAIQNRGRFGITARRDTGGKQVFLYVPKVLRYMPLRHVMWTFCQTPHWLLFFPIELVHCPVHFNFKKSRCNRSYDVTDYLSYFCLNSLAPGKFEWNFRHVIFKPILVVDGWGISCEIALIWMSPDFTDDQSTLVQVMAWCRQATSHYMNQCWPRSISPYGVTRPQWVNYHNLADRNILVLKHSVHKQLITRSLRRL